MKIACWAIGKTNEKYLEEGIQLYEKRLRHYLSFSLEIITRCKNQRIGIGAST
jgi:23S rRNA (pseudouridine1915-N3)-methyltransferase